MVNKTLVDVSVSLKAFVKLNIIQVLLVFDFFFFIDQNREGVGAMSLYWSLYLFKFFLSLRSLMIVFPITVNLNIFIIFVVVVDSVNFVVYVFLITLFVAVIATVNIINNVFIFVSVK